MKSLEDPGLLLKGVSETITNEAKEQKGGFLSYNWCKFLLGNMLAGKGMNRVREEIIRAGYGSEGSWIKKKIFNTASSFK